MFYFRFFGSHCCDCISVLFHVLFVEPRIFLLGLLTVINRGLNSNRWKLFGLFLIILNDDIDGRLFI